MLEPGGVKENQRIGKRGTKCLTDEGQRHFVRKAPHPFITNWPLIYYLTMTAHFPHQACVRARGSHGWNVRADKELSEAG